MNKKLISFLSLVTLMSVMSVTSFATSGDKNNYKPREVDYGRCGGYSRSFMMDEYGDFLSQEKFESKLDKAIEEGYILNEDRDYYANMYEYCVEQRENRNTTGRGCASRENMRFRR